MKNPAHSIIPQLLSVLAGFFLASFVISFVINGVWAFILAGIGGIANALLLGFFRLRSKPLLPGLIIGYCICLIILVWLGVNAHLSVNLWASFAFVLSLGLARVFLSDVLLAKWLDSHFHKYR